MMRWLGVFVAVGVVDYIWTVWSAAVARHQATRAALAASALIGCTGVVTTAYVADPWLLVPAALGAFVGTWLSVARG